MSQPAAHPRVLVGTWNDGVFAVARGVVRHELPGVGVRGLVRDSAGGVLGIVGGHALSRREADGTWRTLGTATVELACCVDVAGVIYAGTEDAQVLHLNAAGQFEPLTGFESVAGRDTWYAGSAIVNGQLMGPPLGVRSMDVTCDGRSLLVNVHVGGIPRSVDAGESWRPTIDIEVDVHQVRAHPDRPDWVVAAAGAGLCISQDAGATWRVEREGLHAPYCSAVAFAGDDILVAASGDHFAPQGAIYRRRIGREQPIERVHGGLPPWLTGICDTQCLDSRGASVALADRAGNVFVSEDCGAHWDELAAALGVPSGLVML